MYYDVALAYVGGRIVYLNVLICIMTSHLCIFCPNRVRNLKIEGVRERTENVQSELVSIKFLGVHTGDPMARSNCVRRRYDCVLGRTSLYYVVALVYAGSTIVY